jgi:hypothetical protein
MTIPPLKKFTLPEIDTKDMTPQVRAQVTVLVEFIKESLRKYNALHVQAVAKQKALDQLKRAKKRALRRAK